MPAELKPMRWPRPTSLLWWKGDYSDIRERIQRTGRLDTIDDVCVADSDDSYNAFRRRHGAHAVFDHDWREPERKTSTRQAERARRLQEEWEEERRQRQLEKQAQADLKWQEIDAAKAYWSRIDPAYRRQGYRPISMGGTTKVVRGVTLEAGKAYWVPAGVVGLLLDDHAR